MEGPAVSNDACDTSGAKLRPHINRAAFPQPNLFPAESCSSCQKHDRAHRPDDSELNVFQDVLRGTSAVNILTPHLAEVLCWEMYHRLSRACAAVKLMKIRAFGGVKATLIDTILMWLKRKRFFYFLNFVRVT